MSRFYCPQVHSSVRSWIDLPQLASKKEKEAEKASLEYARQFGRICRVIRKPHGWEPSEDKKQEAQKILESTESMIDQEMKEKRIPHSEVIRAFLAGQPESDETWWTDGNYFQLWSADHPKALRFQDAGQVSIWLFGGNLRCSMIIKTWALKRGFRVFQGKKDSPCLKHSICLEAWNSDNPEAQNMALECSKQE